MRTLTLPGHWYTDALPGGVYASARWGVPLVTTSAGDVTGRELLWVRTWTDRFAGLGHDGHVWEWTGRWKDYGPYVAPRAVIYRPDGSLEIVRAATWPGTGTQGWRYVADDGTLVEAYKTYIDNGRRIYEYTTRRDVTIGQGEQGIEALFGARRVRLDALFPADVNRGSNPQWLDVNFTRAGDDYAVSWYVAHSPTEYTACIVWLTDAELRALPDAVTTPPIPHPDPTPEPPMPEIPQITDAQFATLKALRSHYPETMTPEQIGDLLNRWAWHHRDEGCGMQRKDGGTRAVQPGTGIGVWNGVRYQVNGQHYGQDVLGGASVGRVEIVRGQAGSADPATFVRPVEPDSGTTPPDPGTPPPPSVDEIAMLKAQMATLESTVRLLSAALDAQRQTLNALEARLIQVEARPAPQPKLPKVTISKTWGHSHTATVE